MSKETIDFEADAPENQELTNEKMEQLTELSNRLKSKRSVIEDLNDTLKEAKAEERELSEFKVPALMTELGVTSIKLKSGGEVTIKEDFKGEMNNSNRSKVMAFIRKEGDVSIIRNTVTILFGKGDEKKADLCFKNLDKKYENVSRQEAVNTGTFKKMCKELIELGVEVPLKEVGLYNLKKTIIK